MPMGIYLLPKPGILFNAETKRNKIHILCVPNVNFNQLASVVDLSVNHVYENMVLEVITKCSLETTSPSPSLYWIKMSIRLQWLING